MKKLISVLVIISLVAIPVLSLTDDKPAGDAQKAARPPDFTRADNLYGTVTKIQGNQVTLRSDAGQLRTITSTVPVTGVKIGNRVSVKMQNGKAVNWVSAPVQGASPGSQKAYGAPPLPLPPVGPAPGPIGK